MWDGITPLGFWDGITPLGFSGGITSLGFWDGIVPPLGFWDGIAPLGFWDGIIPLGFWDGIAPLGFWGRQGVPSQPGPGLPHCPSPQRVLWVLQSPPGVLSAVGRIPPRDRARSRTSAAKTPGEIREGLFGVLWGWGGARARGRGSHGRGAAPGTGMGITFPREFSICTWRTAAASASCWWVPAAPGGVQISQIPQV